MRRGSRAGVLLLAIVLFRAYVPVGYMPANGAPFLLEICPAGLAGMAGHALHHHLGAHADFENCPFGSAPAAAPIAAQFNPPCASPVRAELLPAPAAARLSLRLSRAHQPRGPPALV
jgi:hypothetical protein